MENFTPTDRTVVRRLPKRASYDRALVHQILDEGFVCHVGFVADGKPFVIPTAYGRLGDTLYLHGAKASRMLKALAAGAEACVTVTLVDGLVLARSAFHHSMNYRSVVVFGRASAVEDPREKLAAMRAFSEHLIPGRWDEVREPNERELTATLVLALPLAEVSAKVRAGAPVDDEEDLALPVWAGELPLRLSAGEPVRDPLVVGETPPSESVVAYARALNKR
ncbi:MAG: pyridoxamine 5'-phosphate oxidase family protein [Acidobacteria bacterium]|nr:pyridoxamine 5'-phosphate oxidase family protein [Acidobacteriota bacterium]MCA1643368.1 pyridoxamine 5'-phosphate oxidase family protein [Acidobacteriota bacterium]